jgi:hypothetical protein
MPIDKALESTTQLAADYPEDTTCQEELGRVSYDGACLQALLAEKAAKNLLQVKSHAARAVGLLRQAQRAGFFKDPPMAKQLKTDSDLVALRARDDYKALVAEAERRPAGKQAGN